MWHPGTNETGRFGFVAGTQPSQPASTSYSILELEPLLAVGGHRTRQTITKTRKPRDTTFTLPLPEVYWDEHWAGNGYPSGFTQTQPRTLTCSRFTLSRGLAWDFLLCGPVHNGTTGPTVLLRMPKALWVPTSSTVALSSHTRSRRPTLTHGIQNKWTLTRLGPSPAPPELPPEEDEPQGATAGSLHPQVPTRTWKWSALNLPLGSPRGASNLRRAGGHKQP